MIKEELTSNSRIGSGMELLGEYLKQKRLDKNFSLEKLSQKTKISVNILKCLEANDFDHLPSAAYIKGFVSSYVKVLGLPLDEAINKMEYTYLNVLGKPFPALNHTKAMGVNLTAASTAKIQTTNESLIPQSKHKKQTAPEVEPESPHDVIKGGESIIDSTKSMIPFVILITVILLFVGGYKLISSIVEKEVAGQKTQNLGPKIESSASLVNVNEKKPEATATAPVEAKKVEAAPETTAPATPAAAAVATTTTEDAAKKEPETKTEIQRNYPTLEFKKIKSKLFTIKSDAPENEDEDILPEEIKSQMKSDLQNIYIRADGGNTWLSYKVDNKPITSAIIEQGKDLFLQGEDIRIFLGNVGVTKIFYNNYLIDTPTKTGVKSLIFPEENNSKYETPLFPKANDDILYTAEEYQKRMKLEEEELEKKKED